MDPTDDEGRINHGFQPSSPQNSVGFIYLVFKGWQFYGQIRMSPITSMPDSWSDEGSVRLRPSNPSSISSYESRQSSLSDTSSTDLSVANSSSKSSRASDPLLHSPSDSPSDLPSGGSSILRNVAAPSPGASRPFDSPSGLLSNSPMGGPAEAGSVQDVADPTPSASTPSADDDLRVKGPRKLKKRCLCMKLLFLIAVCAGLAIFVAFLVQTPISTKMKVEISVDEPFQPELSNMSSLIAQGYSDRFCYHAEQFVRNRSEVKDVTSCKVDSFRNGSVVVKFHLGFTSQYNLDTEAVHDILLSTSGVYTRIGPFRIFSNSVHVLSVDSKRTVPETPDEQTSSEFVCELSGPQYKPFPYTFPSYCGEFQLCVEGQGELQQCPQGQEFAYHPGSSRLCHPPSHNTYCGVRRSGVTTQSTHGTTSDGTSVGTTMSTTMAMMTTVTDDSQCKSLDPRIVHNSASLYTCENNLRMDFLPLPYTYPHNCSSFLQCYRGKGDQQQCAPGTHFVLGRTGPSACDFENSTSTYCAQMAIAEKCWS